MGSSSIQSTMNGVVVNRLGRMVKVVLAYEGHIRVCSFLWWAESMLTSFEGHLNGTPFFVEEEADLEGL